MSGVDERVTLFGRKWPWPARKMSFRRYINESRWENFWWLVVFDVGKFFLNLLERIVIALSYFKFCGQ